MKFNEHNHAYLINDSVIVKNAQKTIIVVVITAIMMVAEVVYGILTGSMALLADGWHMATHAGALMISVIAYRLAKSVKFNNKFTFGGGKIIPLGGYTSAVILAIIAIAIAGQSIVRMMYPAQIQFREAIIVAIVGLVVNVLCALILMEKNEHHHNHTHDDQHDHDYHHHVQDHNLRSAYMHVVADALTSIFALVALGIGMVSGMVWLDPAMGIIGSLVIMKWAYNLCRDTAWELLDGHPHTIDHKTIKGIFDKDGIAVSDLHVWRIAPNSLACELSLVCTKSIDIVNYKRIIGEKFGIKHMTIEVSGNAF